MALALPAGAPLTFEDLVHLPADGRRYELIDGALVVTPAPGIEHQLVVGGLYRLLWGARAAGTTVLMAPVGFVPRPETALQPDVVVVESDTATGPRLTHAPLLVVEVVSPSTRSQDLGSKLHAYAQAGVRWYWVVDPVAPVELIAFRLVGDRYVEVDRVRGNERFSTREPLDVAFAPAALAEK